MPILCCYNLLCPGFRDALFPSSWARGFPGAPRAPLKFDSYVPFLKPRLDLNLSWVFVLPPVPVVIGLPAKNLLLKLLRSADEAFVFFKLVSVLLPKDFWLVNAALRLELGTRD